MRKYSDKTNVQKKVFYRDRFNVNTHIPRLHVNSDEVFNENFEKLSAKFDIKDAYIEAGQMVVWIDAKDIFEVIKFFRDELSYNNLSEMSAVDFLATRGEFELFYQLLSMKHKKRARVKCTLKEKESIKSVSEIFKSANWAEREAYDMFGIIISEHPYMKRVLLPDDWSGHPLLKTYPLHGDEAAQWYEIDQIFGEEYRDLIGPEIRDAARIDKEDTRAYARKGHEVKFDEPYSEEPTKIDNYQEDGGVFLITKFKKNKTTYLKKRR
ncbi:MAG: NADH-quinone oxidoreductase subunit C [Campylobacteraceae bacterium]